MPTPTPQDQSDFGHNALLDFLYTLGQNSRRSKTVHAGWQQRRDQVDEHA